MRPASLLALALFFGTATAFAQPTVETAVEGLEHPWALAFLPGGEALVTERPGRLLRVDPQTGERTAIRGTPPVDEPVVELG